MYIYIYICICMHTCICVYTYTVCVYVYIYIYRERERDVHTYTYIYIYMYIYIHIGFGPQEKGYGIQELGERQMPGTRTRPTPKSPYLRRGTAKGVRVLSDSYSSVTYKLFVCGWTCLDPHPKSANRPRRSADLCGEERHICDSSSKQGPDP